MQKKNGNTNKMTISLVPNLIFYLKIFSTPQNHINTAVSGKKIRITILSK